MDGKTNTRFSRIIRQKELELRSSKFERELIKSFNHYVKTSVLAEIYALDDSTQLLNIIKIGEKFQEICDSIGNTPEFKKMFNFLSDVRMNDRNISKLVISMKMKYGFDNPEKFRVKHEISADDLDFILQSLKSQLKSLKQEEEEMILAKQQQKEEKEKIRLEKKQDKQNILNIDVNSYMKKIKNISTVQKIELWAQNKFHPEEIEENKLKIKNYRKNLTEEKKQKIQKDLSLREEKTILNNWINDFNKNLLNFESFSDYNHIIDFSSAFIKFSEVLDEKFRNNPEYEGKKRDLRSDLRKYYKFLEDWIIRVEIKYENHQKRNSKEEKIDTKEIDAFLKKYESNRSKIIIVQEDRRILKTIFNKEKEIQKTLKEKEKAEIKKQKEIDAKKKQDEINKEKEKKKTLKEKEKAEIKKQKEIDAKKKQDKINKEKEIQKTLKEKEKAEIKKKKEIEAKKKQVIISKEKENIDGIKEKKKNSKKNIN